MTDNSTASPDSREPARRNMSDRARATRSFRLAMRQTGQARGNALTAHFQEFARSGSGRTCPLRTF